MAILEPATFNGADGLKIRADVGGDRRAPGVVLMHGGGQLRQSWGKTAHALVEAGWRVASLDLRGHGESDWSPSGDYDLDAYVRDLRAVLGQIPSPCALVGASLGGLAALTVAGERGGGDGNRDGNRDGGANSLVSALVLVDITTRPDPAGVERISAFMRAAPDGFSDIEAAADAVARYMPHRERPRDPSGLRRNLRERDGRLYWHWDPKFVSSDRRINSETDRLDAAARGVRAPTQLVWGLRSEIVSSQGAEHFNGLLPHAEIFAVKDAGHMVAGDKNDAFSEAVISFLARNVPPAPASKS